ncbi:MAG TPA: ATP-binding protein [Syntrophobacteria bacterium]|nr:ATP-binding protein [Syntrophobacteria bacterium]
MDTYEVHVLHGAGDGQVQRLEEDQAIVIGRDRSCQLCIDDPQISRQHARILRRTDSITIEDLNSSNGTFLNGVRIKTGTWKTNDLVTLGRFTRLVIRRTAESASPRPQPAVPPAGVDKGGGLRTATGRPGPTEDKTVIAPSMSITRTLKPTELTELLGRSHGSLRAMYRVLRLTSSILDLDLLLNRILDEVFATIQAERAFVLLSDSGSGQLEVKASRWQTKGGIEQRVSISQHIIAHVLEKKESVLIADAMADSTFGLAQSVVIHKIRSAMCSPLRGRSGIVGIIHVDTSSSSDEFGEEDLLLLDAIGTAAGSAVENAQLHLETIRNERLAAMGQAIAGLSHCIKNILAAMEVSSSLMERGLESQDLDNISRVWQVFRRSSQRISQLVLNMLAYSKERRPEVQPCSINDICREVADLCHDQIEAKKARLHLDLEAQLPWLQADPQGVHRCLLNLLTNAIDAVDEDRGEVRLATRVAAESILIAVEDNGVGIPAEARQQIFEVFYSTKGNRGTGLGLAVTKKIVEEHGGSIAVDSAPGQGSRFTIQLPLPDKASTLPPGGTKQ